MGLVLPPIEAYPVQHLPIVKAYADKMGLVEAINAVVPTEMAIDPGTIGLGMILDTLSGRSPLYRLEEFFTHQDTALLLGKAVAPEAFQDDTAGRVLDRLYATGTMKVFTACAVRADRVFGFDKRYVQRIGNFICRIPGSPRGSRMSEVGEGALVKADEGWTEPVKRDKTATPQPYQHPNSVRPDDGTTLWGLERLQADLCRALGRVYTRPSALPDVLL